MKNTDKSKKYNFELKIHPSYAYDLIDYISSPFFSPGGFYFMGVKKTKSFKILHKDCGKVCQLVCKKSKSGFTDLSFILADNVLKSDIEKYGKFANSTIQNNILGLAFAEHEENVKEIFNISKRNLVEYRDRLLFQLLSWIFNRLRIFGYHDIDKGYLAKKFDDNGNENFKLAFPIPISTNSLYDQVKMLFTEIENQEPNNRSGWKLSPKKDFCVLTNQGNKIYFDSRKFNEKICSWNIEIIGNTLAWEYWGKIRRQLLIEKLFILPGLTDEYLQIIEKRNRGSSYKDIAKDLHIALRTVRNRIRYVREVYGVEFFPYSENRCELYTNRYMNY